jgi:hypothetical protein
MIKEPTCETCRFYKKETAEEGTCWRWPPITLDWLKVRQGGNGRPWTKSTDFCGERQVRLPEKEVLYEACNC